MTAEGATDNAAVVASIISVARASGILAPTDPFPVAATNPCSTSAMAMVWWSLCLDDSQ